MVKNFKGLVKISDIQEEFDKLVKILNDTIDDYNNIEEIEGIDYTKGGTTLGQKGYTLTIGGLKQFMQLYDGCAFGVRVMKTGNNQCVPTSGILVTKDKFYRIPHDVVNGYGTTLYFNPKTGKCQIGGATKQYRSFTQPTITSNSSWGTFSATGNSSNAWKCTQVAKETPPIPYELRVGGWAYSEEKKGEVNFTQTLTWKFKNKLKLYDITMRVYWMTAYSYGKGCYIKVKDLAGNQLGSYTQDYDFFPYGALDLTLKCNGKEVEGLQFEIRTHKTTGDNIGVGLSDLKIPTTAQQEVLVTDDNDYTELYKIADLNWEKTSADKLWLNDLPHSMMP